VSTTFVLKIITVLFILQFLLFTPAIICETASSDEMDRVCANWLTQVLSQRGNWAGSQQPRVLEIKEIYAGEILLARYYNIDPNGFVLIPTLKAMNPIKAYSEEYALDDDQENGFLKFIREMLQSRYELYRSHLTHVSLYLTRTHSI